MNITFTDKVVLITGAGSGFGRLAAQEFLATGAKLILSDVNITGLDETMALLGETDGQVLSQFCDVSKEEDVQEMINFGIDQFGVIDIAINNAGIAHDLTRMTDTSVDVFDKVMAINVRGVFMCMQHEINQMTKQGHGIILNVASVAGLIGAPFGAAYSASKHAVIGLTKSAALEFSRKNIRINAICPAYCYTPMFEEAIEGGNRDRREQGMAEIIPMGRIGTAQEIVDGMMWLCAEQNSFTTGQALAFDGGLTTA